MFAFRAWLRATCGWRSQCATTATLTTSNIIAAMIHTASAKMCSRWARKGRVAAALATIPVPMIDANQLGPTKLTASVGESSEDSSEVRFRRPPRRPVRPEYLPSRDSVEWLVPVSGAEGRMASFRDVRRGRIVLPRVTACAAP